MTSIAVYIQLDEAQQEAYKHSPENAREAHRLAVAAAQSYLTKIHPDLNKSAEELADEHRDMVEDAASNGGY